jgi:hypothetical protein
MCDEAFRILSDEKRVHKYDHRANRDRISSASRAGRSLAVTKTETHRPGRERILGKTRRHALRDKSSRQLDRTVDRWRKGGLWFSGRIRCDIAPNRMTRTREVSEYEQC